MHIIPLHPAHTSVNGSFMRFLFFFTFIYLFYYLFLATLGLCCCVPLSLVGGERGLLFIAVCGLLIAVASLVAQHGL